MNTQIKEQWIAALESGKYTQAVGTLKEYSKNEKVHRHCCLGVLCEIYRKTNSIKITKIYDDDIIYHQFNGSSEVLPLDVQEWAGIDEMGSFKSITGEDTLANLNDNGKSFTEIAEIIKEMF
jgi:hypothetical protein